MDVKKYSLGEIGVFLKSCIKEDEAKERTHVANMWLSHNASQDFMTDYLNKHSNGNQPKKPPQVSDEEVASNWKKLAGMNGDFT